MMPAAKMMDPVMGIDVHLIQPPGPVPPLPVPHPFVGMLFDPTELAPFIGASVFVNGMPKATAGSEGKAVPPHIPIGGVFVPPPPGNECEMFMGSATVLFEGEPASYTALPALSCQSVGMPAPFRPKKKPKPIMKLPTSVVMPIPAGPPVIIGGPPTISMSVLAMKAAMAGLKKAAGKVRKALKKSKKAKAISKKIHKKAQKAMDKLGIPKDSAVRNKVHKGICTVTGHPVDVATGKVFTDNVDFELPGPIPFHWERTWFSTSVYKGPLGHGWHHSYDMALAEEDDVVAVRLSDGRTASFPRLVPGQNHFNRFEKLTLARDREGYLLRDKQNSAYRFSSTKTAKGVCPLQTISDPWGARTELSYDAQGCLVSIYDSGKREIRFETDWAGRITAIRAPNPERKGTDVAVARYAYDEHGNLVRATDSLGNSWRFTYRHHLLVEEVNRNGLAFRFEYDRLDFRARCIRTWGDGGIYDHKLSYDEDSRQTAVTNSLGNSTVYQCSSDGVVTRTRNPEGGITETEFNEYCEVIREKDAIGLETSYQYDERGNCISIQYPDGSAFTTRFDGDLPVGSQDEAGGTWAWTYDDSGRLKSRTDSVGNIQEFQYEGGLLARIQSPSGAATQLLHDSNGNLVGLVDPEGGRSSWIYDNWGRCIGSVDQAGLALRRMFDLSGRLVWREEADGAPIEMSYDPEGNVLSVGTSTRGTHFEYQGLNKMSAQIQQGNRVEFSYDTEERLVRIKNSAGTAYTFTRDRNGEIIAETGFDGASRTYHRDEGGRILRVGKSGGSRIDYAYDRRGRVVRIDYGDNFVEEYGYRADGVLLAAKNPEASVSFDRDLIGRATKETQGAHWVSSAFDSAGRRTVFESSFGISQDIRRDLNGRVTRFHHSDLSCGGAWEAEFQRDRRGAEVERILPGSAKNKTMRDGLGRPTRSSLWSPRATHHREYSWGPNRQIKEMRDSIWGSTMFEYDALGNLAAAIHDDGRAEVRITNALGNLFKSPSMGDRKYGSAGQLLESSTPDGIVLFKYDAEGRLARKTMPDGTDWEYHWNPAGRLRKVIRPDRETIELSYDPFGRRVKKTFRGKVTRWVWDGNLPVHEWVEPDSSFEESTVPPESGTVTHPVTWLFEPETFSPMAKSVGGHSHSIISDYLGTPFAMVDGAGNESWTAAVDIFGITEIRKGNRHDCPFRFPGQYEDEETGLHYNRFRYYDPDSGEYISQDPIGLKGGELNVYGYVPDPLTWLDALGLNPTCRVTKAKVANATDLKTVKKGTKEWKEAVDALKKGGRGDIRVESIQDAKDMLKEARGNMNRYKNYTDKEYTKGYEVHNSQNQRELDVGNDLKHIKWTDWDGDDGGGGHLFFGD